MTIQSAPGAVPFYLRNGYTRGSWFDIAPPRRGAVTVGKVLAPASFGERGGWHQAIY